MTTNDKISILYRDALEKEKQNRTKEDCNKDFKIVDEMIKELNQSLNLKINYLADLQFMEISDIKCIAIISKYLILFDNIGIALNLIKSQFYRKNNHECTESLILLYNNLKNDNRMNNIIENTFDNAFSNNKDKSKITFYLEIINQANHFPFTMEMLGKWKIEEAKPIIINRLTNDKIKTFAIKALGYYKDKNIIPLIEKYSQSESVEVRNQVEKVVNKLNSM